MTSLFFTKIFLPSVVVNNNKNGTIISGSNTTTTNSNISSSSSSSSRRNRKKVAAAAVVVETKKIDNTANNNKAIDKANEKVVSTTTTAGNGGGRMMRKLFEKAAPTITTTKENKPKPAAAEVAVTAEAAAMKNQDALISSSGLLPDRWLDYFCIVGLDPNNVKLLLEQGQEKEEEGSTSATSAAAPAAAAAITDNNNKKDMKKNKNANTNANTSNNANSDRNIVPVLLDRYPKENHTDMEFPIHLPSFCFPNSGGVQPIQCYKTTNTNSLNQPVSSSSSSKVKKMNKKMTKNRKKESSSNKIKVKYHHQNVPEPSLCSMVLTSGSGHRLYCTTLTVYETMRIQQQQQEEEQQDVMKMKIDKTIEKVEKKVGKMKEKIYEKMETASVPPTTTTTRTNWWDEESTSMTVEDNKEELTTIQHSVITADTTSSCSGGGDITNDENVVDTEDEEYYWMVPKCLVVLSHYPFFQAQNTILKELFYTVQSGVSPLPLERYIAHIMKDIPLPTIQAQATIHGNNGSSSTRINNDNNYSIVEWTSWLAATPNLKPTPTLRLEQPPPNKLPLLDVSMEPLFRTLSLSNILVIWATLLQEGKVVLACNSVETASLLTPISEAILSLLFPLQWQGIYIPVLPNNESVFDILDAPVPYLIGVINNTEDSNSKNQMGSQNHPAGVVWVDIDTDTIHLGFKENDPNQMYFLRQQHQQQQQGNNNNGYSNVKPEELPVLPALPQDSSMKLMVELEEIVDPFYLPTVTGIKGNITIGDRSVELNNSCRPPYAQRTKLFNNAVDYYTPTPRKYILSQVGKVPPRSSGSSGSSGSGNGNRSGSVQWNDYNFIPSHMKTKKKKKKNKNKKNCDNDDDEYEQDKNDIVLCGISLDDLMQQFPCAEDTTVDIEEKCTDETVVTAEPTTTAAAAAAAAAARRDTATKSRRDSNTSQDSDFVIQLKRQGRSMQAHADRFMAVFGVDYATPSQYAARTTLQLLGGEDDVLNRQDKIAANLYLVDHKSNNTSERVRQCFLNFFVTTLARYKFFVDNETQRIDEERFIKSLNLGHRQKEYVRMIITSQMFEIFLSQQDISSIRRRRLFDEHIIKHSGGAIEVGGGTFGGNNKTTIKNKSKTKSTSKISTTATATPLLDSIQWREPTIIVPQQPCVVGLKKGRVHCHDRRFPDHLVKEECITNDTVSSWKLFWDGTLCSAFLSCT